jgi:hypothetical protein
MKKYLLAVIAFCSCLTANSQGFQWATTVNTSLGITTDNSDNVYCFGDASGPSGGSFLSKYDNSGTLIYSKEWAGSFHVRKIVFANTDNCLYACGKFEQSVTVEGQNLNSQGGTDGFVAKIDLSGNIQWIHSIGGALDDVCNSLTISSSAVIYVTGACDSTVSYNNVVQSTGDQRMFIASFNSSGSLLNFYDYDFYPPTAGFMGLNEGNYINTDTLGNIFVFATIEGRWWTDTAAGPQYGQYLTKFTSSGNMLWSKLIINSGCYYGYSYGGLEVDGQGTPYVRKRCDAHYGGAGYIVSLNNLTGDELASYGIQEATYTDIQHVDGDLLVTGVESAYTCPCQSNFGGNKIFKRMTPAGTVRYSEIFMRGAPTAVKKGTGSSVYLLASVYDTLRVGTISMTNGAGIGIQQYLLRYVEPSPTSVGYGASEKLSIYPNPADGAIIINTPELIDQIDIEDVSGALVKRVYPGVRNYNVNTAGFAVGFYNVTVYSANARFKEKVVISH